MEKCSKHPTYQAIGKPRSMCEACWAIWDAKVAEEKRRAEEEAEVSTMCYMPVDDGMLRKIAWGIATDTIFTNRHCRNAQEMVNCFPILAMMKLCDRKYVAENPPGLIWEYYSQASPRAVNGLPMFFSAHFLSKEDLPKMEAYLKEALADREKWVDVDQQGPVEAMDE